MSNYKVDNDSMSKYNSNMEVHSNSQFSNVNERKDINFTKKKKVSFEEQSKLNKQMENLDKQLSLNNNNYERQILLLNTIKDKLNEINQLQYKYIQNFPEKYIIDSRKFGDKYINNYSFKLNEPRKINKINFINMILPFENYNIYKCSISYKNLETDNFETISIEKKHYTIENLKDIFANHNIVYDEEKNKFIYDKDKIEFIESDITNQLGLSNDCEIDLRNKEYLDFYINDNFVEKINIKEFTKFNINFLNDNNELTEELIFTFYEENSNYLHDFNNYHLIEFIIQ